MLSIITVPHPTLRTVAAPVTQSNFKFQKFLIDLGETLQKKKNPGGVGLAAPQVDRSIRVFCTTVEGLETFINPRIIAQSREFTLGDNPKEPYLEGCLSMPGIYAPVPRHEWMELEYFLLNPDFSLQKKTKRFGMFYARVIQHELDHLDGVLFTDHALKHEYIIYKENSNGKLEELSSYASIEKL